MVELCGNNGSLLIVPHPNPKPNFALELLVYPALFAIWKGRELGAPAPSEIENGRRT